MTTLRRHLSYVAVGVVPGAALVWAVLAAFPVSVGRLTTKPGDTMAEIVRDLGEPKERWPSGKFQCLPEWPCTVAKARGEVLFWYEFGTGHYFYFDDRRTLTETETVGS